MRVLEHLIERKIPHAFISGLNRHRDGKLLLAMLIGPAKEREPKFIIKHRFEVPRIEMEDCIADPVEQTLAAFGEALALELAKLYGSIDNKHRVWEHPSYPISVTREESTVIDGISVLFSWGFEIV